MKGIVLAAGSGMRVCPASFGIREELNYRGPDTTCSRVHPTAGV